LFLKIISYLDKYKEDVIELILNIQQNEFQVPITINDQPDLLMIPEFYFKGNGHFWVAIEDEKVVGTIALIDCGDGVGTIRKMFVKAEFRGKEYGVGQNLLETLETWATNHDINHLYLGTVEKLKAAMRFYERNGYTSIAKENLPSVFPLMKVDTHFYEKKLKPDA
jgi:putative acetyltransferase